MPIREDVWSHDTCLVCQTQHSTPEEKEEHENEKMHKDRTVVYDFLSKELSCLVPSSSESILYERYYRANTSVAGLDCICELNFSWASSPFWACTICYVAGKTLESADAHLYSSYHKRTYISEYHPDRFAALIKAQQRSTPDKHSMIEQDAVLDVLYDSKGLAPPDVYILHEKERSWAFQKLGISEEEVPAEYVAEPIDDLHSIVHCYICCEDFVAYEKEELLQKAWSAHLATTTHQKCRFILTLLNEAKLEEKQGLPSFCEYRSTKTTDLGAFNCVEGAFYGKSCSFEHLVHFKGSNDSFCKICFCVVSNRDVTDHFASEYHIERCVRKNSPSKLLNAQFLKIEDRHAILLAGITDEMKVGKHHTCDAHFPQLLKRVGSVDKRAFEATNVEEVWVASFKANWCEDCKQYVKLTQKDSWQNHIFEEDHFDWAAKRALCYADGANFVSKSAGKSLPSFRTGQKGWDDRYSVALGLIPIQDHCYFGLQYIVRDELNRQTTCLCCYLVCSYEDDDVMCLHVRSYDHITRVIHLINKKLLGTLWKYTDVDQKKNLVMDYLKHCKLDMSIQRLSIYDPVMACTSNCFGTVPRLLLQLAAIPPELRQSSLLSIESRPNEDINVPLNIAFRSCNVEIKGLESDLVIFFCQECNQAFSCSFEKVDVCFAEHLLSPSHWARQLALKQNPFDENKRIYNLSSSFEVSRFQQPNEKKKITWKWNEARKAYEFVYAQLGLGDVHERRNFSSKRDLYCTLCAETLKASKIELEHHIRSFTHIFYYVHKHRPQTIGDLEAMLLKEEDLATKQKNIRKLFNKALKGLEKEQEEIIIFDFSQGRFCESTEIKAVLEDDHPVSIIDDHLSNAAPMAIYTGKMQKRSLTEGQQFVQTALHRSTSVEEEMNLELAKQKLLNTSEYSVHPDADTANEEAESENVSSHAVSHRGNSVTSNNRKSKSPTPSREGSRSPTYKKFHALPDTHQYDYRARPAFHSFHARASTARTGSQEADTYGLSPNASRFGGAYAYAQRFAAPHGGGTLHPHLLRRSVSPERRPGDVIEPRSREKSRRSKSRSPVQYYRGQRINRSRSPSKKASHRKRSRSRSRSRNKSRGHERSRRSRSRSRSRSKTHSRRHHRSRSKSRGHRSRSKSREERSRSRNRRDNRSRSKSSEVDPSAIQQSLMNRLKKAPAKIQINLPIGKETPAPNPVSSNPYHFRNAPDVSKVKAEIEETGKKAKSRWDTSSDIKPVLPPPTLRLVPPIPASIAQTVQENAKKQVESFAERLLKERGVDLHAILTNEPAKTAPPAPDHNRTISDLMATAASMSSATTASGMVQSTTSVTTEAPLVLPPVNLTQPPPVMAAPFGMPPPASMFSMFPFANPAMMTYPQTQFGAPPPFPFMAQLNAAGIPATPAFQPGVVAPVVVDQAELVMRAKMELYSKDLVNLKTVEELIEYLWKQGYDKIPPEDPALLFNEVLKKRKGILGASTLYQIICYGHPELETYYCGMCNHWTTVSEMFNHMTAPMHRMKYMYRNYRKYYEKAEAETDETIKDILLQKFAESIWQIEGSGQCGHRMRCILNQAAIARLWPEYVTCVDNSWKILDLDDEARRQERPSSGLSSTNGNQNRVAISSSTARPADTTIVCDEPMAISPNRTPEKRESQAILHPGIPADLQEQLIKQYLASRSQNIAEQKETRSSDSRRSRERSRERSPSRRRSPERRRERSRSRSRRSRSRSPYSKSSRRDRRRGERESERSSRRSRSKSRSPKPSSSSSKKGEPKVENWGAKAAAFLDKIGDKRGAMELYVSSLGAEQDVPSPAYEALPATEQAAPNTGSFEDRSRNAPSTRDPMNTAGKAMLASDLPSNSRQQASPRPMDAPTRPSRNAPKADDMAKKRKVMGAMVELQSVFDEEGFISAQTVFSVCQEMGIPPEDVITHPLLRQLAITFNVDLDTVDISQLRARGAATPPPPVPNYGRQYEDGARQSSSNSSNNQQDSHQLGVLSAMLQQAQQQQPQEQRSNPSNIDFKSLGTSPQELMDIMRKIGGGNSATAAATVNQLTGGASASGSRPRAGYAQPELNEEVDYVYPGYDDDQMEEERDPCEIESSINRLTFAFSNKKQPMPQQQQHQSPVPRRNTVTQNQQQQRENFQQQRQQQQYQHQQYQQQQYNEEDMEEEEDEEDEEEEHEQQEDVSYFNRQSGAPPQQRQTSQMMAGGQRPPAHQHPSDPRFSRQEPATGADNARYWQRQQQFAGGKAPQMGGRNGAAAAAADGKGKPVKPNANLEPLGAKRVFGNVNPGNSAPGNDMRQQPAANSKAYGEYNLNAADPRSNQPPAARGGYPPQRNVAERPKAPQQQYDFTADDDYLQSQGNAPQQGGQPRAGNQGPRNSAAANNYMHVAEQIGDDWNSVDSAVRNLLNPHKK